VAVAERDRDNAPVARVRYWAGAQAIAGTPEQTVPVDSLAQVLVALRNEHGDRMARLLEVSLVLVDGEPAAAADQELAASSVVEILPPYAGG
jgi:molybdopterin converting factor small subunit